MTPMGRVWFWLKKVGWVFIVIAGLVVVAFSMGRKNKQKIEIQQKLDQVNAIEEKTEQDIREIKRLTEEKKKVEEEIVDIATKYKAKVEELKKKPDEPKPGDAGKSDDAMKETW